MSLRDDILASANARPIEPVEAFGTTVYVRQMTAGEVAQFYKWHQAHPDATGVDVMVAVLLRTLCDEQGNRQFKDDEADVLLALSPQDIRKAYEASAKLNAISDDDIEAAEGNSDATPA